MKPSTYQVTVKVLVTGPAEHARAAQKLVHALVQETLPGESAGVLGGNLEIVGASAEDVRTVETV